MYKNDTQKDFLWGALVGGSVATLVALLFTTKKGKQLQNKIVKICENIEDTVKETLADAEDKTEEVVEQVGKKITHVKEKAADAKAHLEEAVEHAGKKVAHK